MLNFYQLQTFVTVISEGSMTGAADKLYLTQPAVSQQIRALEEELGVDLLVRGTRQVKPTLQGELLFEAAKRILQLVQQTEVSVKSMGAELTGTLRVGSLNSIGLHLMSNVFSKVLKHNPSLHFKLEYNRAEELIKQFTKGQLDVLIVPDLAQEYGFQLPDADHKFLQKEEFWLVASGRELEVPRQIEVKHLATKPLVYFASEYPKFNSGLMKSMKDKGVEPHIIFESSNVGTLKRVIESGLGWGFLPSHSIRKQVKLGRMVRVHVEDFSYTAEIGFYSAKASPAKKLIDVFYNALGSPDKG